MDRAKEASQAFNINFLTFLMDETENPYKVATSSAYQIHIGQVHSKNMPEVIASLTIWCFNNYNSYI